MHLILALVPLDLHRCRHSNSTRRRLYPFPGTGRKQSGVLFWQTASCETLEYSEALVAVAVAGVVGVEVVGVVAEASVVLSWH